jgi:hypothetical protein
MLVVVGGHSRGAGKTSLVEAVIRAAPEYSWTAVKISRHERGETWSLVEERDASDSCDTGRYLAAGARRAFWLRAADDELARAWPELRGILEGAGCAVVESNAILEFVEPDLYLMAVDYRAEDFKESARRWVGRADAFVVAGGDAASPEWTALVRGAGKPLVERSALAEFLKARLRG